MFVFVLNLITGPAEESADEELVQRMVRLARDGDDLAARRLYRMYAQRVYRAVRPLASGDADAEDITQDTFVQALGSLGGYQRRPGKRFVAWLMTIALNTARKQARRRQRWTPLTPERTARLEQTADPGDADGLASSLDRQRLGAALLEALAELPERDRQVLVLRYGAELDATEVGQLVGQSPAAVRKVCQRQRARLLERLQRVTGEPRAAARAMESSS